MQILDTCPACSHGDLQSLDFVSDVTPEIEARHGPGVLSDCAYTLCRRCELVFARRRQDAREFEAYYAAFQVLENREYAVYPPPAEFLEQQARFSRRLLDALARANLLAKPGRVLNARCECGTHLARLRDEHGFTELYGLDHFESNIRHAREDLKLPHVAWLHPCATDFPFGAPGDDLAKFDLILANHLLTHALSPRAVLATLRGLLRPGGVVVLYNEPDHLPVFAENTPRRPGVINYHKQLFTRASLERLCALDGWRTELLDYDPVGLRWASTRHSLVLAARPAPPRALDELPAPRGEAARAIARGWRKHQLWRWRKAAAAFFLPWHRGAAGSERAASQSKKEHAS